MTVIVSPGDSDDGYDGDCGDDGDDDEDGDYGDVGGDGDGDILSKKSIGFGMEKIWHEKKY